MAPFPQSLPCSSPRKLAKKVALGSAGKHPRSQLGPLGRLSPRSPEHETSCISCPQHNH